MKRFRTIIFPWLALFLILLGCSKDADNRPLAPDFSMKDIFGETVTLSTLQGKIVLLDFWATWCPPCRMAIPELVSLQTKYKDQGLVILGLSMDDPKQVNDKDLVAFKEKFRMNYSILRGTDEVAGKYFGSENMALPTLFLINREGRIVDKHVGYRPGAVEKSLKSLLE